jgi:hypothetical protein
MTVACAKTVSAGLVLLSRRLPPCSNSHGHSNLAWYTSTFKIDSPSSVTERFANFPNGRATVSDNPHSAVYPLLARQTKMERAVSLVGALLMKGLTERHIV